jgi:TRAP transporter TAXI family solute receptor
MALALAGVCLAAFPATGQEKVQLRLATAGIGSAWFDYAARFTELIQPELPAGSGIETLQTAGGIATIQMLQAGTADIGFSFGFNSADACAGTGIFNPRQDKVRGLIGGLDAYYFGTFVTRRLGVTSWEEIAAGKNNVWLLTPRAGSTGEQAARQVLGLLGSSVARLADSGGFVEATERTTTAQKIKEGLADGWLSVVNKGHPTATLIIAMNDMIMLPLPERVIAGMVRKHGWAAAVIPANTFQGQAAPVRTVKAATNILVASSVPRDVVYKLTKAIMENAQKLPKLHVALSDFDPRHAADPALNGNCPLHPGAADYYREAGILR